MDAELRRGFRIGRIVVDEDRGVRRNVVAIEQDAKDARIGLDDAFLARHDDAVEFARKSKRFALRRKRLGRPVGQGVKRHAGTLQLAQDVDGSLDGAGNHLVEAAAERLDQIRLVGMRGKKFGGRVGERAARVLPLVPFLGADVPRKRFHRRRRRRRRACDRDAADPTAAGRHQDRTRRRCAARWRGVRRLHARGRPVDDHSMQQRHRSSTPRRRSSPDPRARC